MPYNKVPTSELGHEDLNLQDYKQAKPGQWFIGVLDTHNKKVYILPIDPQTESAKTNTGQRNRNRYASGVTFDTDEDTNKVSGPVINTHKTTPWKSCKANCLDITTGSTTHERIQVKYELDQDNLLGFTLIKIAEHAGKGFGMLKGSSNTMNMRGGVGWDVGDCGLPSHSFSRATADDKPGTVPGTVQMPANWKNALMDYFKGPPYKITHIISSLD